MRTGSSQKLVLVALFSALVSSTVAYMSLTVAQLTTGTDGGGGETAGIPSDASGGSTGGDRGTIDGGETGLTGDAGTMQGTTGGGDIGSLVPGDTGSGEGNTSGTASDTGSDPNLGGGTTGGNTMGDTTPRSGETCMDALHGALPANQSICKACLARACTATDTLAIGLAKCVICAPTAQPVNVQTIPNTMMPTLSAPTIGGQVPPTQNPSYWEELRKRADDALRQSQLDALNNKNPILQNYPSFPAAYPGTPGTPEMHLSPGNLPSDQAHPDADFYRGQPTPDVYGSPERDGIMPSWDGQTHGAPQDAFSDQLMHTYFQQNPEQDSEIYRTIILPTPGALMNLIGQGLEQLGKLGVLLQHISNSQHASAVVESAMEQLSRGNLDPLSVEQVLRDAMSAVSDAFMHGSAPEPRAPKNILEDIANLLQVTVPDIQRIYEEHGIAGTEESQQAFDAARDSLLEAIPVCRDDEPSCGEKIQNVLQKMDTLRDVMEAALRASPDAPQIEQQIQELMPQESQPSFAQPEENQPQEPSVESQQSPESQDASQPAGVEYEDEVY